VNRLAQWFRYGAVSLISTSISLTVLGILVATNTVPAGWANVIATAVGTVPSFELNRRWVWKKTGKRSLRGEVGPFWVLSFVGLGLSTLAVTAAAAWAANMGVDSTTRTLVIEAANVAAFGTLWIVQFVVLDRVLFRRPAAPPDSQSGSEPACKPAPRAAADSVRAA
jgi:putative flippase GtrA